MSNVLKEKHEEDTAALLEAVAVDDEMLEFNDEFSPLSLLPESVQGKVPKIKKDLELRGSSLWSTVIGNNVYLWRPLTWPEYKEIQRALIKLFPSNAETNEEAELQQADRRFANMEQVVTKCVLFPEFNISNLGELGSGAMHVLYDNIAEASGFGAEYVTKL